MQGVPSAACWSRNGDHAADGIPCSGGPHPKQRKGPHDAGLSMFTTRMDQPALVLASRSQVSTTVSGLSDSDSMPSAISHSARSG